MENKFTVKVVSIRTGLSPQLIRTWEKRYQAVTPQRTATNRRLYSKDDIEKLMLLKRGTSMGMAISTIAPLSIAELYELLDKRDIKDTDRPQESREDAADFHLIQCLKAIRAFDHANLESSLLNASSALGQQALVEKVLHPLLEQVGEDWLHGEMLVAQEHMASAVIRSILGSILVSGKISNEGPTLVVSAPSRQLHELGALMAAVTALSLGWRVIYLGPNLPVDEIAGAINAQKAAAVAMSITYPTNDAALEIDLERFRKMVGPELPVIIGGQGSHHYLKAIDAINAVHVENLAAFKELLSDWPPKILA